MSSHLDLSIRIFAKSDAGALRITEFLKGKGISGARRSERRSDLVIIDVKTFDANLVVEINKAIQLRLDVRKADMFVSALLERDSDIVEVSGDIIALAKGINVPILVSYTCVFDEGQ